MSELVDPNKHVAIATVYGAIHSLKMHQGERNGNEYSLLRLQIQAGQDQVTGMISGGHQEPHRAQQAHNHLQQETGAFLRGFLRQEEYDGRLQWTVQAFRWGALPREEKPRAVFYVVGTLHELGVDDSGLQTWNVQMIRSDEDGEVKREEYLSVIVWPEFEANLVADKTLMIRGRMVNRYKEDEFGVPASRSVGLMAECIQYYNDDSQLWSGIAERRLKHARPPEPSS